MGPEKQHEGESPLILVGSPSDSVEIPSLELTGSLVNLNELADDLITDRVGTLIT